MADKDKYPGFTAFVEALAEPLTPRQQAEQIACDLVALGERLERDDSDLDAGHHPDQLPLF